MLVPFCNVQFFFSIDCNLISVVTFIVNYVVFCVLVLKGIVTFNKKKIYGFCQSSFSQPLLLRI